MFFVSSDLDKVGVSVPVVVDFSLIASVELEVVRGFLALSVAPVERRGRLEPALGGFLSLLATCCTALRGGIRTPWEVSGQVLLHPAAGSSERGWAVRAGNGDGRGATVTGRGGRVERASRLSTGLVQSAPLRR